MFLSHLSSEHKRISTNPTNTIFQQSRSPICSTLLLYFLHYFRLQRRLVFSQQRWSTLLRFHVWLVSIIQTRGFFFAGSWLWKTTVWPVYETVSIDSWYMWSKAASLFSKADDRWELQAKFQDNLVYWKNLSSQKRLVKITTLSFFFRRIYFIRISRLKFGEILRIKPRLRFWKG